MRPRLLVLCLVLVTSACDSPDSSRASERTTSESEAVPGRRARLERVTDGDTIVVRLDGARERVRLIGIDTPETQHSPRGPEPFADEATAALTALLGDGELTLRLDVEERDRYGRLLAYVYATDGTFVNAEMVRRGWARPLTVPPNVRHADLFRRLVAQARRERLGIWR